VSGFGITYGTDYNEHGNVVEPDDQGDQGDIVRRRVRLTPASTIRPRPVRWTWADRVPLGEVTLTPGKGGVGKSTFHAWMIAHLTRGTLPGVHFGTPKVCIIAASEDSWERTIVPRLIVAGADMAMVYRVDVTTEADHETTLTLPVDCAGLEGEIVRVGAVLLSVDPLMSTISGVLDTHKDRDVRQVLEPLARLADRTGCTVLGNAHFNKSAGSDPMSLIMGSAAFGNVARAALGFAQDTDAEDGSCVISQVKNNLGRLDLPSLRYVIEQASVSTDEGPAYVGKLLMLGESDRSVSDILRSHGDGEEKSERAEAADWLIGYLTDNGGEAARKDVFKAARGAGFSEATLKRARSKAGADADRQGFGGGSIWRLNDRSAHHSGHLAQVSEPEPNAPNGEPNAPQPAFATSRGRARSADWSAVRSALALEAPAGASSVSKADVWPTGSIGGAA